MKTALVEGLHEIIKSASYKTQAENLYQGILSLFPGEQWRISTKDTGILQDLLPSDIDYIIAHSYGTIRVMKEYRAESFPNLRSIILLDPTEELVKHVEAAPVPVKVFISEIAGRPFSKGYKQAIHFADDHFFTQSVPLIRSHLQGIIETG